MAISSKAQGLINSGFSTTDVLADVTEMVRELRAMDEEIDARTSELQTLKQDRDTIASYVIPKLFANIGLKNMELEDGTKVTTAEKVHCSLPKEDVAARERALDWIDRHGGGSIIKDVLTVESPTPMLIEQLRGNYRIERKRDIHASTLKSFMSELLGVKQGAVAQLTEQEVAKELSLYVKQETSYKLPKGSKDKE